MLPCRTYSFCLFVAFVVAVFLYSVAVTFTDVSFTDFAENVVIGFTLLSPVFLYGIWSEVREFEREREDPSLTERGLNCKEKKDEQI